MPAAMKKPRGRTPGVTLTTDHRLKIQNSNILSVLIEHAEGKREMSPSQVTAGLGLLKKSLPDLQTVTHQGDDKKPMTLMLITGVPRDGDPEA